MIILGLTCFLQLMDMHDTMKNILHFGDSYISNVLIKFFFLNVVNSWQHVTKKTPMSTK
jgi:hypothetical protein